MNKTEYTFEIHAIGANFAFTLERNNRVIMTSKEFGTLSGIKARIRRLAADFENEKISIVIKNPKKET
jgi:hypothetical protein